MKDRKESRLVMMGYLGAKAILPTNAKYQGFCRLSKKATNQIANSKLTNSTKDTINVVKNKATKIFYVLTNTNLGGCAEHGTLAQKCIPK